MQQPFTCRSSQLAIAVCLISLTTLLPVALAQQCPTDGSSTPQSCEGPVESTLSQAKSDFSNSCPGLSIRDCDPVGEGWRCSSAVIGSDAPGGTSTSEACEDITPVAQSPISTSEPSAPEPAPAPEPTQAPELTPAAGPVPQAPAETLNPDTGPVELVAGLSDAERYGYRYANANSRLTLAAFSFNGSSETLTLTVTGYDIDYENEVAVLVNGNQVGFLTTSPDNGAEVTSMPINVDVQRNGTNSLEFRQKTSGWRWGVTDIMLTLGCNYPLIQN